MSTSNVLELLSCIDVTTVLIAVIVFLVVGYFFSMREESKIPPGPPFWPVVGNLLDMKGKKYSRKRHKYFEDLQKKYGNIFRVYFGRQLLIVFNDFESIYEAFVNQNDVFSFRPTEKLWAVHQSVKDGRGVIWANGQEWKDSRRMALKTLRDLGVGKSSIEDKIKEETSIVLELLTASEGKPIQAHDIMMKATTNIISGVVFGKRFDYSDPAFLKIMKVIDAAFKSDGPFSPIHEFPFLRFIPVLASKLLTILSTIQEMKKVVDEVAREHRQSFTKGCINDFIDMYLNSCEDSESSTMSEGCMKRTVLDLFIAGSDTTANTLDWGFLFMVLNDDVQKKCQAEIDNVVGTSRMVSWSDRANMPYMEATLLEVQRLGNTVPTSLPHTPIKDTVVKGFRIPKGSLVYANMYACHLDPKYWKEPLEFRPERFLDADGMVVKQPQAFMPFSIGPRICPGEPLARMELFLFFTSVLQRFNLSATDKGIPKMDALCGISLTAPSYDILVKSRSN